MNPDLKTRVKTIFGNPAWVCFTWFGMTAGVSMLATPLRFSADTITRSIALDVGRVVFAGLNKAEFLALIILLVLIRFSDQARKLWAMALVLAAILIAQGTWLLPELAARTDLIIAGIEPEPSIAHGAYSIMELTKLGLLFYMGYRSMNLLADGRHQAR